MRISRDFVVVVVVFYVLAIKEEGTIQTVYLIFFASSFCYRASLKRLRENLRIIMDVQVVICN